MKKEKLEENRNEPAGSGFMSAQTNENIKHVNLNIQNNTNVGGRLHATQNAITLISLIITIIILLILAGVALNLTIGENGIFKLAQNASQNYLDAQEKENNEIAKAEEYIQNSRETITIPKEDYNNIVGRLEQLENQALKRECFIDTDNLISTIANDSAYSNVNYSYTATEDCAIVGTLTSGEGAGITIKINDKSMRFNIW